MVVKGTAGSARTTGHSWRNTGGGGRIRAQAAGREVIGDRRPDDRVERQRVGQPVAPEARFQGGDALAHVAAAPATAARDRAVARRVVHAFEPDHPAAGGAQGQGPVEIHPEVPASLGVTDRVRGSEADGAAHAALPTASGSGGRRLSNQSSRSTRPLRPHSAPSLSNAIAGQMTLLTPRAISAAWNRAFSWRSSGNGCPARSRAAR